MVGGRFKNWNIERVIGRGGMGTVYLARHVLVGRPAAIKVVRPPRGMRADDTAIARFHVETELHVALRHPNLPEFFDAELMADGTAVLILEYLDGFDLSVTLHKLRTLALGDALFVATEVLRALMVMHATSVHRDVKPSNIFLCRAPRFDSEGRLEKGRVRLLDFGIAKLKNRKGPTKETNTIGTTSYMSPEQLMGLELDGRSDLYALGAVLYEAIVGHPVFVRSEDQPPPAASLVYQHVHTPAPDVREEVPTVPEDAARFVARLLEKAPRDRFDRTEEALDVARALRQRHVRSALLFREEVSDVVEAVEALSRERARVLHGPVVFQPREPVARAAVASADTLDAPPLPAARFGRSTDRMAPETPRSKEQVHRGLRGPRCFDRPAFVLLESQGPRAFPLSQDTVSIGSGVGASIRIPGLADAHLILTRSRDQRVHVKLHPSVPLAPWALGVDGQPAPQGAYLALGSRLAFAGVHAALTDLAVWDPAAAASAPKWYPARVEATSGARAAFVSLDRALTLVGSAEGCDLVVPGLSDAAAAFWARGDGSFEVQLLDTSVLPYGDPVVRAEILRRTKRLEIAGVRLDFVEGAAPPAPVEPVAPPSYLGARNRDRLAVTGVRAKGCVAPIPDGLVLPSRVCVVGSAQAADVVLPHELIAGRHARLSYVSPGRYRVEDLGTTTGTFANRRRVRDAVIGAGDYVDFGGGVTVQLVVGEPPPSVEGAPAPQGGSSLRATLLERLGLDRKQAPTSR
ncbi:MAG: FHA domain-containing serine/threonine-protein kinase [Polyangiaceae bacterium]